MSMHATDNVFDDKKILWTCSFPLLYLDVASNVAKFFFYLTNGLKIGSTVKSVSSQHQQLDEILSDVPVRVRARVHVIDIADD